MGGEITKDGNEQMRSKFAQIGRAHGLPKSTNNFLNHLFEQLLTQPTLLITESANF